MSTLYDGNGNEISISGGVSFKDKKIGILGDSITWGTGASDSPEARSPQSTEKGYAPQLAKHFKNSVILGYPGYTTAQIMANVAGIPVDRDYVVFFGGTNDGPSSSSKAATFKTTFETAFSTLRQTFPNAIIVALTPYILPNYDKDGEKDCIDAIIQAGRKFSIPVLDLYSELNIDGGTPESKSLFFADNVHPNDAGHKRIYETVLHYLNTI